MLCSVSLCVRLRELEDLVEDLQPSMKILLFR
jgi:hypothetical protein